MCTQVGQPVHVCGEGQRLALRVSLYLIFETGSLTETGTCHSFPGRLGYLLVCPRAGVTGVSHHTQLLCGSWASELSGSCLDSKCFAQLISQAQTHLPQRACGKVRKQMDEDQDSKERQLPGALVHIHSSILSVTHRWEIRHFTGSHPTGSFPSAGFLSSPSLTF